MESIIKERLIEFIASQKMSINKFEKECGLSTGYIKNMRKSVSPDKLQSIVQKFPELNPGWLMAGEGNMLKSNVNVSGDNSGVVVNGNNSNSPIDNRHYYSDSPDVLKAQIELLDERIKEKDAQIKEKDAQIKEKDAQIKEKDAQIKQLLDILASK